MTAELSLESDKYTNHSPFRNSDGSKRRQMEARLTMDGVMADVSDDGLPLLIY